MNDDRICTRRSSTKSHCRAKCVRLPVSGGCRLTRERNCGPIMKRYQPPNDDDYRFALINVSQSTRSRHALRVSTHLISSHLLKNPSLSHSIAEKFERNPNILVKNGFVNAS